MLSAAHNTGIYKITNTVTGKVYVGSAADIRQRKANHFSQLKKGKHHSAKLQNSYAKHGADAFVFDTLLLCDKADLVFYEQRTIDAFNAHIDGYNMNPKAGNSLGRRHSEATKRLIGEKHKGNSYALGAKRSDEVKARISAANKGRKMPADVVARHAELMKGNTHTLGRKLTEEHKAKLRGRKLSEDHRAKLSASLVGNTRTLGHKLTEEHKAKIAAAITGRKYPNRKKPDDAFREKMRAIVSGRVVSEETKAKMSLAMKESRARRKKEQETL